MQRIREWKLQETLGHPYNSTIHTCTHTYACLHFNKAKLFSLWRRTSCTYDSNASSMYYIQPVTVRRSITQRIAIITSNHLDIRHISIYMATIAMKRKCGRTWNSFCSNIYTKMHGYRYSNYRWWTNDPNELLSVIVFVFICRFSFLANFNFFFFLSSRMITFDSLKTLNFRKIHHLWI